MPEAPRKPGPFDERTQKLAGRLWRDWMRPHWRDLVLAVVLMAIVAGTTGAYPLLIDFAYSLFTAKDIDVVWLLPLLILAVVGVKGVAFFLQLMVTNRVVLRVINALQKAMFAHLMAADLARLTRDPTATLVTRFTADVYFLRDAMSRAITGPVRDLLTVLALLGAMLYLDWLMTLLVLAVYPIAIMPVIRIGKRLRRSSHDMQTAVGETTALLTESLASARMVKTYRLETHETDRIGRQFDRLYTLLMKIVRHRARLDPIMEVLGGVAVGGVIAFAGWRVANGEGTVGEFTGFISALLIAAQPIRSLGTMNAVLQEGLAAAQRVFEVLDEPATITEAPDAKPLRVEGGTVRLEAVEFGYGDGKSALKGVDLTIPSGQTVALVGRSGAGKSTVFNLVPRLFDVSAGRVTIDGQDVRGVTLESLRNAIGLVSQDVLLFNDTVRTNIALGRLDASEEDIVEAAKAAAAHRFIEKLPQGYDTIVGDRGQKLSGGERQRVALARAVLKNAPILLLDEATSALDAESEMLIQEALDRLSVGRTTLVIAHRLATVRKADLICVMDDGRIVEEGTHEALLSKGGLYARLARMQFREDAALAAVPPPPAEAAG